MNDPYWRLFNVFHPNGEAWDSEEVEEYISEHDYEVMDFYDFLLDRDGNLYIQEKCGLAEEVKDPKDFRIKFND